MNGIWTTVLHVQCRVASPEPKRKVIDSRKAGFLPFPNPIQGDGDGVLGKGGHSENGIGTGFGCLGRWRWVAAWRGLAVCY